MNTPCRSWPAAVAAALSLVSISCGREPDVAVLPDAKVLLYAEFTQEVNSFSPVLTTERDFRAGVLLYGEQVALEAPGRKQQLAGFLRAVADVGQGSLRAVPILQADSMSGGPLERAFYERIKADILSAVAAAPRVDGVYLSLHGAMGVEGMIDPEGDLLVALRELLGPGVPIAASFDLHANITERRTRSATVMVGYRTNPHRDHYSTGRRAGELLARTVLGEIKPVMAVNKLALLKGGGMNIDFLKPFSRVFRAMKGMEKREGVLDVSMFPVHIWIDDPELGYSTIAITDGDPELARATADEIADLAWEARTVPTPPGVSPEDAVDAARKAWLARALGTVVFCDVSDAVGTGTPGESTWILKALLERGSDLVSYLCLRDAVAAGAAFAEPVGKEISLSVGGKLDLVYNRPIDFTGTVAWKAETSYGKTVILRHGGIHLVLSELPMAGTKPGDFTALGLSVWKADIVVVKNLFPFRYNFLLQNRKTVNVMSRGLSNTDVFQLEYRLLPRPIYPLDEIDTWRRPQAQP